MRKSELIQEAADFLKSPEIAYQAGAMQKGKVADIAPLTDVRRVIGLLCKAPEDGTKVSRCIEAKEGELPLCLINYAGEKLIHRLPVSHDVLDALKREQWVRESSAWSNKFSSILVLNDMKIKELAA